VSSSFWLEDGCSADGDIEGMDCDDIDDDGSVASSDGARNGFRFWTAESSISFGLLIQVTFKG
jgi:hypothetical protein